MGIKKITKENFRKFVADVIRGEADVVGVQEKEPGKFHYAPLKDADMLRLDYDVTLSSPKKYLTPPVETLVKFGLKPAVSVDGVTAAKKLIVIGVHPYDLKAINQMDTVFADVNKDENYLGRRRSTIIISVDPQRASEKAFWAGMSAAVVDAGFDLHLTDIGNAYTIAVGTAAGADLLKRYASTAEAENDDLKRRDDIRNNLSKLCKRRPDVGPGDIKKLLKENYNSGLWSERAEKCYGCGSCNLVCPTCYCFDVREEMDLNLDGGQRVRLWDGCLLDDFALVGTGENFREKRADRIRHRIFRKGVYLDEKYGLLACVGCGRCSAACLPDIADPADIFNELNSAKCSEKGKC